ncbi:MAG: class I SAM-dependent methyltransferase [Gemmatimonadota bacterium]|nr:MAG: class I SAM-dependent methyltransferase [Gemmatimonadota bacterium]
MKRKEHWDAVYRTQNGAEIGWFESEPATSLRFIEAAALGPAARILDVGAGTSMLVDSLLERGCRNVGVLDVSPAALELSRIRLGDRAPEVEWFVGDVTEFRSPHTWDLWHDRAMFHFLTEMSDRQAYRETLGHALAPGGQVVIATYGPEGPTRCSGLDVRRYDSASLQGWLGDEFQLVQDELVDHTTPGGVVQQYLFTRFRRS